MRRRLPVAPGRAVLTARRGIVAGATLCVAGLALAGTAPVVGTAAVARVEAQQTLGGLVVLIGWAILVWAIHSFGRNG